MASRCKEDYGSGAVVLSWYLLFLASKPKSGKNSTYSAVRFSEPALSINALTLQDAAISVI